MRLWKRYRNISVLHYKWAQHPTSSITFLLFVRFLSRVPVPTRLRVERWSFSFMELLNDAMGRREFMTYLEKEFSGEKQERGNRLQIWSIQLWILEDKKTKCTCYTIHIIMFTITVVVHNFLDKDTDFVVFSPLCTTMVNLKWNTQ